MNFEKVILNLNLLGTIMNTLGKILKAMTTKKASKYLSIKFHR